jgi:mono/diheme cytochrome c family protein/uncharacterized membrane protein
MSGLATTMALMRGLHLAAAVSLLGTAGFMIGMLPAASVVPDLLRRQLIWLSRISGLLALLAGAAWLTLQAATIADADNLRDGLAALPLVAQHTRYGTIMMARLGLLVVATGLVWRGSFVIVGRGPPSTPYGVGADKYVDGGPSPARASSPGRLSIYGAFVLTFFALGLQGKIGHAGATAGAVGDGLVLSESLHLLAAGIWLGALLPLWFSLRALTPDQAAAVCERFSPIGLACVLVLAGTGFAQGLELIGGLPALFGTPYGHVALLKIALFLLALVLAACNRLWLTDRLTVPGEDARRNLLTSVSVEICAGLALVTAAAFMASLPPAAHSTPVWPFSWQFSLITVNEDPDFRQEVMFSLIMIGAAVALMVAALLWRRRRLIALAVLALAVVLRGPSLSLLTVEAYPTSFQTSPTDFAAGSITRGQKLFAENCAVCHGANGDGTGPAAAALRIKPADLTMPHIWEHTDGELFWWLTHGIDDPEDSPGGKLAMPGFAAALPADDRWALIDYIRAHSAGVTERQVSVFIVPVPAPAVPVTCAGVVASRMSDLRGYAVHVVTTKPMDAEVSPQHAVTLDLNDTDAPAPGSCVAADPAAWNAYAILADLPPETLAGSEFLVDPNGQLRAIHRAGTPGGWQSSDELNTAISGILTSPIHQPTRGQHEHHH